MSTDALSHPAASITRPTRGLAKEVRAPIASVALACYSAAALAGYIRVFDSWDFAGRVIGAAVIVHAISLGLRSFKVGTLGLLFGLPVLSAWLFLMIAFPSTVNLIVPTGGSFSATRQALAQVIDEFPTATPPIPVDSAWLPLAIASAVLVAAVSELFAFAANGVGESLAPGAFIFVLIAALGSDRLAIQLTIAIIFSGIVVVAALGWYHHRGERLQAARPPVAMGAAMVGMTAIAIAVAASWLGPRLPGASEQPIIDPTEGNSAGSVTTITSPMVDIRSRLTNQSEVPMFTVEAEEPTYWRATTLPEFDGEAFRLPARELESVDGAGDDSNDTNTQRLLIAQLNGRTVPAAAEPTQGDGVRSDGTSLDLRINRDTSTLVAPEDLRPGDSFTIVSQQSSINVADLSTPPTGDAPDGIYFELPDSLPDVVSTTAAEVTGGEASQYGKMLALQNWFRTFEYSVETVAAGHNNSAIETFLENRVGYCEQFAATFAAMSRTLGYPSRVAVGFTTGQLGVDNRYLVQGKNAHAWPEVYFPEVGWVPFEPTPGQGIPGAEEYTGVEPPPQTVPSQAPATTAAPAGPSPTTAPNTAPAPQAAPSNSAAPASTVPPTVEDGRNWSWIRWVLAILLIAALVALPRAIREAVRAKERQLEPAQRARSAWQRSLRAAKRAGVTAPPGATPSQWVSATSQVAPVAAQPMQSVANSYDLALYGAQRDHTELIGDEVSRWADQVEEITVDSLDTRGRIASWFRVR